MTQAQNNLLRNAIIALCSLIIASGGVIAAFADSLAQIGSMLLVPVMTIALVIIAAAYLNERILIPRFLVRQKYPLYAALCFIAGMAVPLVGIAMEAAVRNSLGLPHRIHDYLSPWILVDSLFTGALLMVIFAGMGVAYVYRLWHREVAEHQQGAEKYSAAIVAMKKRIRPREILESLDRIQSLAGINADEANARLLKLSARLRHELYEMPKIDLPGSKASAQVAPQLGEFISAKKYTLLRDICLKVLIASVSVTAIFDTPDTPMLSHDGLWAFLGMYLGISLLTYGCKSLCKHFLSKGQLRKFIIGAGIFLVAMTGVLILFQAISYHPSGAGESSIAPIYSALATVSSFVSIALYFGGITAVIVLNKWLRTVKRTATLKARTARAELDFLQSQINPHFLFNVLNNAGILIYEDKEMACGMLARLRRLLEYQFERADKQTVRLGDEVDFLRNYLLLEQSRKSPYQFSLHAPESAMFTRIPPLLLIPFVENASKHSTGTRDIRIAIEIEAGSLIFTCQNSCNQIKPHSAAGGLGIANTRRRLQLMYGNDFTLKNSLIADQYTTYLKIPLKA